MKISEIVVDTICVLGVLCIQIKGETKWQPSFTTANNAKLESASNIQSSKGRDISSAWIHVASLFPHLSGLMPAVVDGQRFMEAIPRWVSAPPAAK